MKKILLPVLTLIAFTFSGFAQKKISDANAQERAAKDFKGISVSHAFDVYLTQGNEEKVVVSASEEKYLQYITVEVKNGVLYIGWDKKFDFKGNKKLKAYISYKTINSLRASGACDVEIVGTLAADDLDIDLSGASDLKGKLTVRNLKVDMSGSSDMKISGEANEAKMRLSGACSFKGFEFATGVCDVRATGASDVKITVNKELSADLSGASDISYKGTGTVRDVKSSGASSIRKAS